jgi:hypothetical protein
VLTTRFSYLRRALTTEHGHEVIFVGSGGIWTYRDRTKALANIHRELAALLRQVKAPPRSRFGDQPQWLFDIKKRVRRLLGRTPAELYDLGEWTVFKDRERDLARS